MLAFSQPVFDMQRVFRVVLDAMSRPARLCRPAPYSRSPCRTAFRPCWRLLP